MTHQQTIPVIDPRPMTAGASFLAGGGTGGHVILPAVARELAPLAEVFVGTEHGMEHASSPEGFVPDHPNRRPERGEGARNFRP